MKIGKNKMFIFFLSFVFIIYFYLFNIYSTLIQTINNNFRFLQTDNEEEGEVLHLIKFNFTTKHNSNEIENPITYLILNDVTVPLNLGTPNQTIFASLRFNDYPFFLSSNSIKIKNEEEQNNFFIKDNSSTYRFIASDSLFYKSQLLTAEKANETFYFNDNNIIINNFTFYYATKMNYNQSGGVIGLYLEDSNMNLHSGMNFLTQLKNNKVISYKTFFINYKNDQEGEIIFGAYPHEYAKDKYKYEDYRDIKGYAETTFVTYGIIFDEINIGNNKIVLTINKMSEGNKKAMTADFRLEFGYILAPSVLEENITKEFIDLYKCNAYIANFKEIYGNKLFLGENYKYYVCDYSYNKTSKLSFLSREMEYIFELDQNDLFKKIGSKTFFNIIFLNNGYNGRSWIFGKPMFLKYKLVFDPDKKRLGFYDNSIYEKEKEDYKRELLYEKNIKIYVILIITIIVFIIVLIIFIYQFFFKKFRKIRHNEITEDFVYEQNDENYINHINQN